jgi:hypothetical protein
MTLAPFRGFWNMQSEVDRLFNDMVGDLLGRRREGFARERLWAPRLGREVRGSDVAGALGWSEEDLAEVRRVLRPVVSLENEDLERG